MAGARRNGRGGGKAGEKVNGTTGNTPLASAERSPEKSPLVSAQASPRAPSNATAIDVLGDAAKVSLQERLSALKVNGLKDNEEEDTSRIPQPGGHQGFRSREDRTSLKERQQNPDAVEVLLKSLPASVTRELVRKMLTEVALLKKGRPAFSKGVGFHRMQDPVTAASLKVTALTKDILKDPAIVLTSTGGSREDWSESCTSSQPMDAKGLFTCFLMNKKNTIRFCELNINGLGSAGKQGKCKDWIRNKADIAVLTDTRIPAHHNLWTELKPSAVVAVGPAGSAGGVAVVSFIPGMVFTDTYTHASGRLAGVVVHWGDLELLLVALYLPAQPENRAPFYRDCLESFLKTLPKLQSVPVMGDLNVVEDPVLDKSSEVGSSAENRRLMGYWAATPLTDVFRFTHLGKKEYTFHMRAKGVSTTIDRALATQPLPGKLVEVRHADITNKMTDHWCAVVVALESSVAVDRGLGIWRLRAAQAKKKGVRNRVERVLKDAGGDLGNMLPRLTTCLRVYTREEKKRVGATKRHLEKEVKIYRQRLRSPNCKRMGTILLKKEELLDAYEKSHQEKLQEWLGVKAELDGETTTGFLSGKVKMRKAKTEMSAVNFKGVTHSGAREVLVAATEFFKDSFGGRGEAGSSALEPRVMRRTLCDGSRNALSALWLEEEVRTAALERARKELAEWEIQHLTTTARVTIINGYISPIFMFQAYIYPPPEEIWTKIKRICHNFVSGGEATEEKAFILWNYELICTPREEGGLGMICPKKRFDNIAVQNVGRMMLQANLIKKWLTERAAAMPLGPDTIYAHQSLLKHWTEGSKRWKGMLQSFWKSPFCVTPEPENRWEVEREQLAFNRRIPFRGASPFGNQKGSARLLGLTMGDLIWRRADGSRGLKDKEALASELGSAEAAKLALKAFGAAPARWREQLLETLTSEEIATKAPLLRYQGGAVSRPTLWKVTDANSGRVTGVMC
ncbi:unnamed protein product [Closterium sp. NIES-64]|nr:unnamed protein product [Closterium sp. NIES-64]